MTEITINEEFLEKLLDELINASTVLCFSDVLLRSKHKVLSFTCDDDLKKFYSPYLKISELIKFVLAQQKIITSLEAKINSLEQQYNEIKSEFLETKEILKKQTDENQKMKNELALFYSFCAAVVVAITALQKSYEYLETHKFKFSVYDLINKINQIIEPNKRHSFEIEGTGIFESVRFTAAKTVEPNFTISKLLDLFNRWIQQNIISNSEINLEIKEIFSELLESLEKILNSNLDQLAKAQKFGLRLKVVNFPSK